MQWTSVLSLALLVQAQATVVRTRPESDNRPPALPTAEWSAVGKNGGKLTNHLESSGLIPLPPPPPKIPGGPALLLPFDDDATVDSNSLEDTSTKLEDTATKLLAGNKAEEEYNYAKENANYEEAVDDETAAAQEEAAETAAQVEAEMKAEAEPKKKEEAKKAAAKTEKKDAKAAKKGAAKGGAKKEAPTYEVASAPAPAPAPAEAPAAAPETAKSTTTTGPQTPAQRRMRTINHVKEAGDGYQPGSPLYKHQEKWYKTHEKSAAFQHMPLACLVVALTAALA